MNVNKDYIELDIKVREYVNCIKDNGSEEIALIYARMQPSINDSNKQAFHLSVAGNCNQFSMLFDVIADHDPKLYHAMMAGLIELLIRKNHSISFIMTLQKAIKRKNLKQKKS
jgi:hypothetical protein